MDHRQQGGSSTSLRPSESHFLVPSFSSGTGPSTGPGGRRSGSSIDLSSMMIEFAGSEPNSFAQSTRSGASLLAPGGHHLGICSSRNMTPTGRCHAVSPYFNSLQDSPGNHNNSSGTSCSDRILLGVCCMRKKQQSPTMQAMLARFAAMHVFSVVLFDQDMILSGAVSEWPRVDVMIAFHSSGFPLDKAIAYSQMHPHTYYLTHPESQPVLLDRRDVLTALTRNNIPVPRGVFCSRDGYQGASEPVVEEGDDFIVVNGVRLNKPFVEKPVSSEDHNVYIYKSRGSGGGCAKLFRKKEDSSSEFDASLNCIRRDGKSYVYEEFLETSNMRDVKCYTVGPNFVFAEERKAPVVDGVVLRDELGKEVRNVVALTVAEQMVARKVIKVFRQMVCGFDILRCSNGNFFVIDVNGWSFVKNNDAYVVAATEIIADIFCREVHKRGLHRLAPSSKGERRTLLGFVGVFRHADRTPKQKVKLIVSSPALLSIVFDGSTASGKSPTADSSSPASPSAVRSEEVVFKTGHPKLQLIQQTCELMLEEISSSGSSDAESSTASSGNAGTSSDAVSVGIARLGDNRSRSIRQSLHTIIDVVTRQHEGLKVQVKPMKWAEENGVFHCTEAMFICKWGGWMTAAGEKQAEMLGHNFIRRIFGAEPSAHCLKASEISVRTNTERRVIHSGSMFARALLNCSNSAAATPQLPDTVLTVDEKLLGNTSDAKEALGEAQRRIAEVLHYASAEQVASIHDMPGLEAIIQCPVLEEDARTPLGALRTLHHLIQKVVDGLPASVSGLYGGEPLHLLRQRWEGLASSFQHPRSGLYDVSKIPDICDYVSFDVCYNQEALAPLDLFPLYTLSEVLSAFVACAEFGATNHAKKCTAALIASPLMRHIRDDIVDGIAAGCSPRTRIYFTSESHVTALKNLLSQSSEPFHLDFEPLELHFLSHFVFKVYEYEDSKRLLIEVHFSSGMEKNMFGIVQEHHVQYAAVSPMIRIHNALDVAGLDRIVREYDDLRSELLTDPLTGTSSPRKGGLST